MINPFDFSGFKTVNGMGACTTLINYSLEALRDEERFKTVNGMGACTTGERQVMASNPNVGGSGFKTVNGMGACTTISGEASTIRSLRKVSKP